MSVKTLRVCLWWVLGSLDTLRTVVRVPAPMPHGVADGTAWAPKGQVLVLQLQQWGCPGRMEDGRPDRLSE